MSKLTTMSRVLLGAVSLTWLLFATIPTAAGQAGVNGRNATTVAIGQGATKLGELRQTGPKQWVEANAAGAVTFRFEETDRDDWSIYLIDRSRGVNLQLDLYTRKVMYSDANSPRRPLYDITTASAQPLPSTVAKPAPSAPAAPTAPVAAPTQPVPASPKPAGQTRTGVQLVAGYSLMANAAILGHNLGEWKEVSVAECAEVCNNLFTCRSFDYKRSERVCNPSDKAGASGEEVCPPGKPCVSVDDPRTTVSLKKDYPGHPYDHYRRVSPPTGRAVAPPPQGGSPRAGQASAGAAVPGYTLTRNAGISGHDLGEWRGVSAAECAGVCNNLFACRSFNYNRGERICNPSDRLVGTGEELCPLGKPCVPVDDPKTTALLKKDFPGNPFDHYNRGAGRAATASAPVTPSPSAQPSPATPTSAAPKAPPAPAPSPQVSASATVTPETSKGRVTEAAPPRVAVAPTTTTTAQSAGLTPCRQRMSEPNKWKNNEVQKFDDALIAQLCERQEQSTGPADCFHYVMSGQVQFDMKAKRSDWNPTQAARLCRMTPHGTQTAQCFQTLVARQTHWDDAIESCRVKDPSGAR